MTGPKMTETLLGARLLSMLGLGYYFLGDHKKAIESYSKALLIYRNIRGQEHSDVALTLNNLGIVHSALGDQKQAIESHNQAYMIYRKILRKPDLTVAWTLNN